jgi:site-specific recombinase XerC
VSRGARLDRQTPERLLRDPLLGQRRPPLLRNDRRQPPRGRTGTLPAPARTPHWQLAATQRGNPRRLHHPLAQAARPSLLPPGRNGRRNRSRLSPSTHREYRRSLELHILPRLGQRPLARLQPAQIDQLIAELEQAGLAPGTIRNAISPLRKLLGDAVRQGLLPTNPASCPELPPAQDFIGQELPLAHSTAIRTALVTIAQPDPLQPGHPDLFYLHLFDLALGTGMRLGELRALQWQQIDRQRRLIRVEHAYSRGQLKQPKTEAGIRSVPIFGSVQAALDQLAARALERGRYAPSELIFANQHGRPLSPSNVNRRYWQPALRAAGLIDADGKTDLPLS